MLWCSCRYRSAFLSTLSLRRATLSSLQLYYNIHYFYPRSPCGERREVIAVMTEAQSISIHALLAESDKLRKCCFRRSSRFLSTLSLRRATKASQIAYRHYNISIHALLAESDQYRNLDAQSRTHFYPRSPCGERPIAGRITPNGTKFLSTLSLRRATRNWRKPHEQKIFLSTLSLRRATTSSTRSQPRRPISIHALLAESDQTL